MQKITQLVFKRWMTILSKVPDSVLWLLTGTAETNARLTKAAEQCGIAAQRLVFAEKSAAIRAPGPLSAGAICFSTRSLTVPTRRPPTPCGWACRS